MSRRRSTVTEAFVAIMLVAVVSLLVDAGIHPLNLSPDSVARSGDRAPVESTVVGQSEVDYLEQSASCALYCVTGNLSIGSGPTGMAYDPADGSLYVANEHDDNVSIVNTTTDTVSGSVSVGSMPWGAVYDDANREVYVTNNNFVSESTVSVISGSSVVANISVGNGSQEMAYQSSIGEIYVSNWATDNVSLLNGSTNTVQATISGLTGPVGETFDPVNGDVYVAQFVNPGKVAVIHGTSIVSTITGLGNSPQGIIYDPIDGDIYVANQNSNSVSVVNGSTNSVIANITVGSLVWGITCDSVNGDVFVADGSNSDSITVISGTAVVKTIVLANSNWEADINNVLFDPQNGDVYATAYAAARLYVISVGVQPYKVTFSESGLPTNAHWSVVLTNGQVFSSTSSAISFKESNGTLGFTIVSADKRYRASGGALTVEGKAVSKKVKFELVTYRVTFSESGLSSGAEWWVNLTNGQSFSSTEKSIYFLEANGTYDFSTASKGLSGPSGSFVVAGSRVTHKVKFT